MKKDKLYTVDKGLASVLQKHTGQKNLFALGDALQNKPLNLSGFEPQVTKQDLVGLQRKIDQANSYQAGSSNTAKAINYATSIIGAIPTGERRGMFDTLDPLHHLAGGRENEFGNAMGDAGVAVFQMGASTGNAPLMIAGAVAKGLGSLVNAGWGIKENKENTAFIKQNTQQAQAAGSALAQSSTSGDFIANAGNMVGSSGFSARDLYKNGWFTNKGTRKGNALLRKENSALAMQGQGMMVGANNVDSNLDDNIFGNFRALGGPMEEINNHNMGAIEYGLMSDYLIAKNRQNDTKNKIGGISPMPMLNGFAEGGEIEIKHPGRLTALKKRTGKTEAELWAEGKPEVRKMITFARNARKWKKAYGGYIEAANNLFALGGPDDPPVGTTIYRDVYDPNNPQAGIVKTKEFIPMQPKAAEPWEPVANINKDYVPQYGGMYGHIPQGMSKEDGEYYQKVLHDYADYPITTYSYGYKKGAYQPYRDDYELMNVHNYPNGALGYDIRNAQGTTQYIPTKDGRWFRMAQAANEMGEPTGEYIDTLPEFDFNKYTLKSTDGENYIGNPNLHALGGDKKSDEELENLMFYLSQKEKYPNGRKKTEAEKFLNYRLGIPERKTAPWFEETPTYIPESPSEHLDRVLDVTSKIVKGIGRQTKKTTSKGEPYIPHVKFALGGDIQTNSADFSTGLTHIDAGGSHESNPYEGIQVGVDSQNVPNLVEENETIYNDYVYSNRIEADQETLKKFHLPKKAKLTYADITKRLEKEIKERPNDPLSKAAFKAQMESLAEEQERQKKEMEAARAREAFEALGPEEQTALMQQMAQQEAMAQEAAQEQAIAAEQQDTVNPEEAMDMEAPTEQVPTQPMEGQYAEEQPMMAYGGKVNKFAGIQSGSNQMRNAGTWKTGDSSANWNTYTRGGLRDYLQNIIDRIRMAPDDKTANEIRQEAIKTVAGIQQAYAKAYQNELTPVSESEAVRTLQSAFQNAGGNRYFGNISDNINLPVGHNTTDTEKGGWVDSLWGPRTSIRNWGSTEYGDSDYYKDIADLATQAGMVYAPNADWTYGDNTLYGLSIPEAEAAAAQVSDNTPDYAKWTTDGTPAATKQGTAEPDAVTTPEERKIVPVHRAEWPRYAGLFGPAAGLLMQGLGIGKPNTKALDGIIDAYDKRGAAIADYQPIGNYLRFRPMDIWAEQNRLNANARATDRAIANSGSNQGSKMAGLLANEYNNQIGSGQLYRQALEYNDALRERVAAFNRGTDQFNAEAYNRTALQNAEVRNRDRQYRAQLGMQAAMQKAAQDAAWNQGIYGNVAGLFKGIGDLGRENYQHNRIADMAATGIFGTIKPETFVSNGYLQYADEDNKRKKKVSKGGRINKRKGGLTY